MFEINVYSYGARLDALCATAWGRGKGFARHAPTNQKSRQMASRIAAAFRVRGVAHLSKQVQYSTSVRNKGNTAVSAIGWTISPTVWCLG